MVECCTSCSIFELRGVAITVPVMKQYRLQRFVFLRKSSEQCVRLASGDYNITERSQFDTNATQLISELLAQDRIYLSAAVTLQIDEQIVQRLHSRLTIKTMLCLQCHHSTATIAELGRSYGSVSLYNLSGNTSIHVSAIRSSEKLSRKKLTMYVSRRSGGSPWRILSSSAE